MNDLSRFRALRKQILPWDFIAWDGTGFVSDGIEFVERASVSHISWVLDPSRPIDGEKQEGFDIIEATIENGALRKNPTAPQVLLGFGETRIRVPRSGESG